MDLSKVKMVVTDMDGTLLNSNHEVSQKFLRQFQELKKRGIKFVAASGRQYFSILDKLDTIKDDIIVVAENGAYVKNQDKEILTTYLDRDTVKQIIDLLRTEEGVHIVLCSKTNAYISGESTQFVEKLKEYYSKFKVLDDLGSFDEEILKVALFHFDNSEKHIYPLVKHMESQFKVKVSGENWLDISDMKAHKGYALQKLQELYGIGQEETMVFGDYNNDLEMLEMGHFSFAMANAHPNVTAIANFSTGSNDELGVEQVIAQLLAQQNGQLPNP